MSIPATTVPVPATVPTVPRSLEIRAWGLRAPRRARTRSTPRARSSRTATRRWSFATSSRSPRTTTRARRCRASWASCRARSSRRAGRCCAGRSPRRCSAGRSVTARANETKTKSRVSGEARCPRLTAARFAGFVMGTLGTLLYGRGDAAERQRVFERDVTYKRAYASGRAPSGRAEEARRARRFRRRAGGAGRAEARARRKRRVLFRRRRFAVGDAASEDDVESRRARRTPKAFPHPPRAGSGPRSARSGRTHERVW